MKWLCEENTNGVRRNAAGRRPFRRRPAAFRAGPGSFGAQFTLTALQAAATASYSVLPAPYRSLAALRVAVRAPA
jgi:hypothetical protein